MQLQEGQSALVLRVGDQDPEKLRYLGQLGLYPETRVKVLERAPFGGPVRLLIGEKQEQFEHMLGAELAEHILVSPIEISEVATR